MKLHWVHCPSTDNALYIHCLHLMWSLAINNCPLFHHWVDHPPHAFGRMAGVINTILAALLTFHSRKSLMPSFSGLPQPSVGTFNLLACAVRTASATMTLLIANAGALLGEHSSFTHLGKHSRRRIYSSWVTHMYACSCNA